jgi:putative colanic acid biosynthesis acetyltransferase WcaF
LNGDEFTSDELVPVINLADAPGEHQAWDKPKIVVYLWAIIELLFVTNPWQISSSIRVSALRLFGAEIGKSVLFRPRTRVWFHNQNHIFVGHDVSISQETFLTTGSHSHRRDMALVTKPIYIREGAWLTSRCVVLGGVTIGRSALIRPNTVVGTNVPANAIFGTAGGTVVSQRFPPADDGRRTNSPE